MDRKLYLFDFDGTITNKDSFIYFFITSFGFKTVLFKLILNSPKYLLIFLMSFEISKVKEKIVSDFFKNKSKDTIEKYGIEYSKKFIYNIIRLDAIDYIKKVQLKGHHIFIVSASLDIWLNKFSEDLKVELICTKLKYQNNLFTGKFEGKNCKGIEKVNRLKEEVNFKDYTKIISFGDSKGDSEMFAISNKIFYKPFRI